MKKRNPFIIAAIILVGTSTPVMAAESSELLLNEKYEENSGLVLDTESLNEKYNEMLAELKEYDFGEAFQIKRSEWEGYSMDAVQLFQDSYGDLWNEIELGEAEIPKNFSASECLQKGLKMRNEIFSEIRSSQIYQNVMGRMDVSRVWEKASGGLPSAESLLTNQYQQNFSNKAQGEKLANESAQAALQESTLDLFTESGKLLGESSQSSFWSAVEDMRDIISEGEDGVDDIFDQME